MNRAMQSSWCTRQPWDRVRPLLKLVRRLSTISEMSSPRPLWLNSPMLPPASEHRAAPAIGKTVMSVPIDLNPLRRYQSGVIRMCFHRLSWMIALALGVVGCCSEETPANPVAQPTASASASESDVDVPHRRLLGKWRYDGPTDEQLTAIERRSRSISERDRVTRAARELTGVTTTFTKDRRRIDLAGGKPLLHRYEVLDLEDQSITIRLSPLDGAGKPFEETLKFTDDGKMVEVVDGMPRLLTRLTP